jgi:hypothetical protein
MRRRRKREAVCGARGEPLFFSLPLRRPASPQQQSSHRDLRPDGRAPIPGKAFS